MQQNGVEIACHGHLHLNTKEDVLDNIAALKEMKVDVSNIGFASPNSEITEKNDCGIGELAEQRAISYIRSGLQIRREGIIFAVLSVIGRITRSKKLFISDQTEHNQGATRCFASFRCDRPLQHCGTDPSFDRCDEGWRGGHPDVPQHSS